MLEPRGILNHVMHSFFLAISYALNATENPFILVAIGLTLSCIVGYFDRRYGIALFFTLVATFFITDGLKAFFKVARPTDALVTLSSYRFPSMHAAFAGALAGSMWWHVIRRVSAPLSRIEVTTLAITFVVFVSYTRIILGVHEPIDLLVGALVGIFVALPIHWYLSRTSI